MNGGCAIRGTAAASLPRHFLEQSVPAFQGFLVLGEGAAFFRIPALEAIVFPGAAEIQIFQQFLPLGTQNKIGEKQRGVPKIVNGVLNLDMRIIMPYDRILIGVLAILLIVAFIAFMHYSRTGRAMRALAQDKVAAQLMGVNVSRYSMIGFALGAMLAGLVGGLLVTITGVNLGMGGPTSVKAFLMIMIGGAGVISGAIAGGFILGMMESVGLTVLSAYGDITYLVIFASLMAFLAVRPQGLMGKPWG